MAAAEETSEADPDGEATWLGAVAEAFTLPQRAMEEIVHLAAALRRVHLEALEEAVSVANIAEEAGAGDIAAAANEAYSEAAQTTEAEEGSEVANGERIVDVEAKAVAASEAVCLHATPEGE